ncbi:hypothetical protein ABZ470_19675 [Streptosporangium sp. NPDC020072]|uniref:hypothetical protein n=1 Tax=Streptosporangium sp. NPDC020072 TaxID=3154788 RepID=UPI003417D8FF
MNSLRTVVAVVMAGAFLTSCGSAPTSSAQVKNSATATPTGGAGGEGLYPSGFDPGAYTPPDDWQEACKKNYTAFAVPLLAGWNAIRGLVENSEYSSYHSGSLKVIHEMLTEPAQQKVLKACLRADPVVGGRFENGVAVLGEVVDIVCRGEEARSCGRWELTADERVVLGRSIPQVLAALPPKRQEGSANVSGQS